MSDIFNLLPDALFGQMIERIQNDKPIVSRYQALTDLYTIPAIRNDTIPTMNRLSDWYGLSFMLRLLDICAKHKAGQLTVSHVKPITVNPMAIMAMQDGVSRSGVEAMLKMRQRDLWRIVRAEHDEKHPIILVPSPVGYISVNGHHRIRALQFYRKRKETVHVLPHDHDIARAVNKLFLRKGYAA